jgi:shikimate kinase
MSQAPIPFRQLVFLLGFMGCGKTTVGRRLAQRLGWSFLDLDEEIERRAGRTIAQIFAEQGEPHFRRLEHELLAEIVGGGAGPTVVALGGGTFAQPANVELIRSTGGVTFWLECPIDELRRRCRDLNNRPLLRDPDNFRQLYQQRLPFYQQADLRVDADRSDPSEVVEEILQCGVL